MSKTRQQHKDLPHESQKTERENGDETETGQEAVQPKGNVSDAVKSAEREAEQIISSTSG